MRPCDHPGCAHGGEFRAPRSRDDLRNYYWFCLDHVRAYNAAWDYYAGLNATEIEQMVRQDTTWQRPTWPLGSMMGRFQDVFGLFEEQAAPRKPPEHPASPEEKAMKAMDLAAPLTLVALKARYKELVKRHHPDANGGDKASEERFKEIGQAYKILRNSLNA